MEKEKKVKVKIMLFAVGTLCLLLGMSAYAGESKSVSKGNVVGFVEIWTQDVSYLESEINNLMSECGKE